MKSIGAVLVTALLLSACSHSDIFGHGDTFGIELEIRSDEVTFKPTSVEVGGSRSHCSQDRARKNLC